MIVSQSSRHLRWSDLFLGGLLLSSAASVSLNDGIVTGAKIKTSRSGAGEGESAKMVFGEKLLTISSF